MRYRPFDRRLANPKTNIGCALVFVLIALVYAANTRLVGFSAPTTSRIDACTMAQEFVSRSLKAPSTATFAPCQEADITGSGGEWRVISYVDAENGFGAMLRTRYDISMSYNAAGDTWQVVSLSTD